MDLVVLDELGYLPFSQAGGALLFHLLSKLYEHTSVLITNRTRSVCFTASNFDQRRVHRGRPRPARSRPRRAVSQLTAVIDARVAASWLSLTIEFVCLADSCRPLCPVASYEQCVGRGLVRRVVWWPQRNPSPHSHSVLRNLGVQGRSLGALNGKTRGGRQPDPLCRRSG